MTPAAAPARRTSASALLVVFVVVVVFGGGTMTTTAAVRPVVALPSPSPPSSSRHRRRGAGSVRMTTTSSTSFFATTTTIVPPARRGRPGGGVPPPPPRPHASSSSSDVGAARRRRRWGGAVVVDVFGMRPSSSLLGADEDYGRHGVGAIPPPPSGLAVSFEDVESDYYDGIPNEEDDHRDLALTDEEARALSDREERGLGTSTAPRVERCILVGVEDLSSVRKARRTTVRRTTRDDRENVLDDVVADDNDRPRHDDGRVSDVDVGLTWSLEESMVEMRELIKTAGLSLEGEIVQRLQEVNPKTYIGTGKVVEAQSLLGAINEELERRGESACCTVVFDAELTPGQQKALENAFNRKVIENDFLAGADDDEVVKVVDRTALILDIFAQHARTREGKLQVDLALHEYRKPRLTRMWTHLERQSGSGGVGLRGPGETQLEVDKRILRDRILVLKEKIDMVQKQRDLHRRGRRRGGLPVLALVGYTNAGKSTLLNCLTKAGILAEDILFATLDPTTRRVKLPGYKTHPEVLLTDTVGFIQKLPTQLVAAFRATLEEVKEADVLVHIIDVSNPCWRKQENSVTSVLGEIGAGDKPIVRVFNKLDLLDPNDAETLKYEAAVADDYSVGISSLTGEGLSDFVAVVEDALSGLLVPVELEIPYSCGNEINHIHEVGSIEVIDYREKGTFISGRVPRSLAMKLQQYSISDQGNEDAKQKNAENEIDWVALGKGRHEKKSQ